MQNVAKAHKPTSRVGFFGLLGVMVAVMVGGGAFNIPQNLSAEGAIGAQLIAWVLTAVCMGCIVATFRILSIAEPQLKDGIYTYARAGFGHVVSFFSAYGYWIYNTFSLIAYGILISATLSFFTNGLFGNGSNTWWAIGLATIINWTLCALNLRGFKQSATLGLVASICKLIPIVIFLLVLLVVFQGAHFASALWGQTQAGMPLAFDAGRMVSNVGAIIPLTMFCFLGTEGAVVASGNATSQKDVSRATVIGFLAVLAIYILISILPYGIYTQAELAGMQDPSMSQILTAQLGPWAGIVGDIGVIISLLGAWMVYIALMSQMPLYGARDGVFPKVFGRCNAHGVPTLAVVITGILTQVFLVAAHFMGGHLWTQFISISSTMSLPCYTLCCAYLAKRANKTREWPECGIKREHARMIGVAGLIAGIVLIALVSAQYILIDCLIYAVGIPLLLWAFHDNAGLRTTWHTLKLAEKCVLIGIAALGILGLAQIIVAAIAGA